ncbi:MAG: GvpL/GvpF family gas vesicle protein [Candidatus Aerophobetes bacterium]|nr:GvpL/GvpF family gas vesicle protein [Candidatus Aerophobetes bacterium]
MEEGRYIYGVIGTSEEKSFGPIGMGKRGNEVYTVPYQDIAAVISDSPIIDYKSLTKDVVAKYLLAHQSVIEQVMKHHTIIPFKFGTTAESNEEIKAIMFHGYPKFTDVLKKMQGKIELDVMALWDKHKIFKDIAEEPGIKKFKEAIKQNPSDQDRIKLGMMVAASLDKGRKKCAREILGKLGEFAEDLSVHEVMGDEMIANVSLLIRKDREKRLDSEIGELDSKYGGRVNFRCVGPLPPYSFSVIEVKKISLDTLQNARNKLKLPGEATLNEVKHSYRRLASEYHPDKNSGLDSQSKFQAIKEAYDVLAECCRGDRWSLRKEDFKDFFMIRMLRVEEGAYKPQGI